MGFWFEVLISGEVWPGAQVFEFSELGSREFPIKSLAARISVIPNILHTIFQRLFIHREPVSCIGKH